MGLHLSHQRTRHADRDSGLLPKIEKTTPGKWAIGQALILIAGMISVVHSLKAGLGAQQPAWLVDLIAVFGIAMLAMFVRKQLRSREPMLDLSLLSKPAIIAGIIMAMVAAGASGGVELTLAQELHYVLGETLLRAGIFMIPIMTAAALGGPVAGFLSNRFGLRAVATFSLALAASALVFLGISDFHDPGLFVPVALALLGLTLGIGLTSSSIAIMGSVDARKGGAAGSRESTGYELGNGLGITLFGVFAASVFSRAIDLQEGLDPSLAERASRSIGDTFLVTAELSADRGGTLIEAGRAAFSQTHTVLLTTAAGAIGVLAVIVFFTLANYRPQNTAH